jgi:hypothetical protein
MIKVQRPAARLRALTSATLLVLPANTALARCPEGSYPWVDRRGIEYCRQDVIGPREASLADDGGCPQGTRTCGKPRRALDAGEASAAGYLSPAPTRGGQREAR